MDNVPIILGQYRLEKTLGIGAFGKVKSKQEVFHAIIALLCRLYLIRVYSDTIHFLSYIAVAHHIITGQKVAVKILNKGKIKHMEMAEKVIREINILKMCTHPHIIRL